MSFLKHEIIEPIEGDITLDQDLIARLERSGGGAGKVMSAAISTLTVGTDDLRVASIARPNEKTDSGDGIFKVFSPDELESYLVKLAQLANNPSVTEEGLRQAFRAAVVKVRADKNKKMNMRNDLPDLDLEDEARNSDAIIRGDRAYGEKPLPWDKNTAQRALEFSEKAAPFTHYLLHPGGIGKVAGRAAGNIGLGLTIGGVVTATSGFIGTAFAVPAFIATTLVAMFGAKPAIQTVSGLVRRKAIAKDQPRMSAKDILVQASATAVAALGMLNYLGAAKGGLNYQNILNQELKVDAPYPYAAGPGYDKYNEARSNSINEDRLSDTLQEIYDGLKQGEFKQINTVAEKDAFVKAETSRLNFNIEKAKANYNSHMKELGAAASNPDFSDEIADLRSRVRKHEAAKSTFQAVMAKTSTPFIILPSKLVIKTDGYNSEIVNERSLNIIMRNNDESIDFAKTADDLDQRYWFETTTYNKLEEANTGSLPAKIFDSLQDNALFKAIMTALKSESSKYEGIYKTMGAAFDARLALQYKRADILNKELDGAVGNYGDIKNIIRIRRAPNKVPDFTH